MTPELNISIPESEYTISATRASGPGGQHVNKVSTAIVLRFDIQNSSLSDPVKTRLLAIKDSRITDDGILIIKSSARRSQLRNKEEAVERLIEIVREASIEKKPRKKTKPSKKSVEKRLEEKTLRSSIKEHRKKPKLS